DKNAVVYNQWAYEPQTKHTGDIDAYIINLESREKKLLLTAQQNYFRSFVVSPGGSYIAYFKGDDWWSYDLTTGMHMNMTETINISFVKKNEHYLGEKNHQGFGGWMGDDSCFLVHDSFDDYWLLYPKTAKVERITFGREKGLRFEV